MELPNGIESSKELLDAQAHIWNHVFRFASSMSLKCAVELRIPDIISKHGKPMTLTELIGALSISKAKSLCIKRLMRLLVHSKFFTMIKISEEAEAEAGEESYWLTPASRLLVREEAFSVTPLIIDRLDPVWTGPWHHMSEWFRSEDATPTVTAHGRSLWELASEDQRLNQLFNESMASDTKLIANIIVQDFRRVFEGLRSMVDVGGGVGTASKAISDAFPDLKCVVLDLPHVVAGLEGTKNLSFIGGDMFQAIPPADAIFMKWILHDWPDEECVKILKKCKNAIPSKDSGGKVIIVDIIMEDQNDDVEAMETKLFCDMRMICDNDLFSIVRRMIPLI